MTTLMGSLAVCIAVLGVVFLVAWKRSDWHKIDEANDRFFDADGDHIYYDRHIIEQKRKERKDTDT